MKRKDLIGSISLCFSTGRAETLTLLPARAQDSDGHGLQLVSGNMRWRGAINLGTCRKLIMPAGADTSHLLKEPKALSKHEIIYTCLTFSLEDCPVLSSFLLLLCLGKETKLPRAKLPPDLYK